MVVGDLRRVEDPLRLLQCLAGNGFDELRIDRLPGKFRLVETVQRLRTLRIDIIREILRVHTGIGGVFPFIECLDKVEGHLRREAELTVAVHLQRGEVVKLRGLFLALLLLHLCHGKRFPLDSSKSLLTLLLRRELTLSRRKYRVTIDGGKHPVRFGFEVLDLLLPVDNQSECRCLHTSDGEHLPVLSVFEGIETCGIHTQQPVTDGTRQSRHIQRLVVSLVLELRETLADSLVSHRRYPQTADRTFRPRLLHHPALDEFSLLSGITAVDDAVSLLHESLDDGKLLLDARLVDELDAETFRYHRQRSQVP